MPPAAPIAAATITAESAAAVTTVGAVTVAEMGAMTTAAEITALVGGGALGGGGTMTLRSIYERSKTENRNFHPDYYRP